MTVVHATYAHKPQRRGVLDRFLKYEVRLDEQGAVAVLLDFRREFKRIDKLLRLGPRAQREVRGTPQAVGGRTGQLHQAEHPPARDRLMVGHSGIQGIWTVEAFRTGTLTLARSLDGRGDRNGAEVALRVGHKAGTIGRRPRILAEGAL